MRGSDFVTPIFRGYLEGPGDPWEAFPLGPSWSPPGASLGPLGQKHENDPENTSKMMPELHDSWGKCWGHVGVTFWVQFWTILGTLSGPLWGGFVGHFLLKIGSPKGPLLQGVLRGSLEPSQEHPGPSWSSLTGPGVPKTL